MDWNRLRLLILDVDGVLTDGRLWATTDSTAGDAIDFGGKAFHVQDGLAIKQWQKSGGSTAILSGRTSPAVEKRAAELGIRWCITSRENKIAAFDEILQAAELTDVNTIYMGDDLPDAGPMLRAALPVAVRNAVHSVKRLAGFVTRRRGGEGAVAEVVEYVLRKQGKWSRDGELI